jgi:uroporphyrinogen decarboxylase
MPVSDKLLLSVLKGKKAEKTPLWLMRQAGRYLPEYRALRAEKGGFLALAMDPDAAAEITLQPIRRFAFDGAILFSDILTVPWALGQDLAFEAGEGPRLSPPLVDSALASLTPVQERLEPVYRTVEKVRRPCLRNHLPGLRGQSLDRGDLYGRGAAARTGDRAARAYRESGAFAEIIDAVAA